MAEIDAELMEDMFDISQRIGMRLYAENRLCLDINQLEILSDDLGSLQLIM